MAYDLLIKGGRIYDGSGAPWYRCDVAVRGGRIAHVAPEIGSSLATTVLDARDMAVSPGFIDPHSHDDSAPVFDRFNLGRLSQGVTTVIAGNCGYSLFPVSDSHRDSLQALVGPLGFTMDLSWHSCAEMASEILKGGSAINMAYLVGHNAVRVAVMGTEDREPTPDELLRMKSLVREGMAQGALGFSSGLIYVPGVFSKPGELIELARVIREFGGVYATHLRDEGDNLLEAMNEAIAVGREAGVPVHIAHHKVSGASNWGRAREALDLIGEARAAGIDVTADAYPYTAGASFLASALPPFIKGGGDALMMERLKDPGVRAKVRHYITHRTDWQNWARQMPDWNSIVVGLSPRTPEFEGKSVAEISSMTGRDPVEALMDVVAVTGHTATAILFLMDEADVRDIISSPLVAVGTDAMPPSTRTMPHPRGFGTYARVLGRYAREQGLISMEEAVRKMTSMPAIRFNLQGKGLIRQDFDADMVIFDPSTVIDNATYREPALLATGIAQVLVDGVIVFADGEPTGLLPGRWIGNGYAR